MQSLPCNLCSAIFALQFMLWALQKPFRNRCTIYVHLIQKQVSCISMLQGFWASRAYLIFALQPLHCNLGSGRLKNHFVTGAWFPCICYGISDLAFHCSTHTERTSSLPLPTSKSLELIALSLLGLSRAYLAIQLIIGFHCSEPTGLTAGFWRPR